MAKYKIKQYEQKILNEDKKYLTIKWEVTKILEKLERRPIPENMVGRKNLARQMTQMYTIVRSFICSDDIKRLYMLITKTPTLPEFPLFSKEFIDGVGDLLMLQQKLLNNQTA